MKHGIFPTAGLLAAFLGAVFLTNAQRAAGVEPPPPPAAEEDFEVLTRGPVHEAFAESVTFSPEPGIVVETTPPELIEELPPETQPEGDNVNWVPGYWGWDDDQGDFLWISGVWRNLPPGRQWVPGYWNGLDEGGWQWVSGYWADAEQEEVAYLGTAPPQTLEAGPSVAAPSTDHSWIPGVWLWADTRYVWRPGYWSPLRTGWTWVPARYCWTPRGFVFIDGYWDYSVGQRGVLFAPVHFRRGVWGHPGFHYRPSIVVSLNVFSDHLFYRPRACHYYFGDYYEPRYRTAGYTAVYAWHSTRGSYDPIYAYQRWSHRDEREWEGRRRERFAYLTEHVDARPPRTWAAMSRLDPVRSRETAAGERVFASTLDTYAQRKSATVKFRKVDEQRAAKIVDQRRATRDFSRQRQRLESAATADAGAPDRAQAEATVRSAKLANSPIVGRSTAKMEKAQRPPQRLEPKADVMRRDAAERLQTARAAGKASQPDQAPSTKSKGRGQAQPSTREQAQAQTEAQTQPMTRGRATQQERTQAEPKGRSEAQQAAREQAQQKAKAQQAAREQAQQKSGAQQQDRAKAQQAARERAQSQQQDRAKAQQAAREQAQQKARAQQAESQQKAKAQQAAREQAQSQQKAKAQQAARDRAQQQERAQAQQKAREQSQAQAQQKARAQQAAREQAQQKARAQQQERARAQQQQQQQRQQPQRSKSQQTEDSSSSSESSRGRKK